VNDSEMMVVLFALMIFAGIAVLWMAMQSRRRFREMEHRERLAMIERGLIPSPELDPAGFERSSNVVPPPPEPQATSRARSTGVMLIGFGLGLTMLLAFAFEVPEAGVGLGGAFALLGAAFVVNAMLSARDGARDQYDTRPATRYERRDPPPTSTP
jgi:hypothetical protein